MRFSTYNKTTDDASDAVQFVLDAAERNCESGLLEKRLARAERLESIVGQLLQVLTSEGVHSRTGRLSADQVSQIFNYDVSAED